MESLHDSDHQEKPLPRVENLEEFDEYFDDDEFFEPEEGDEREESDFMTPEIETFLRRLSSERFVVRVNDVVIKGNTKTSDSLIASEVEPVFRDATSFQQLLRAATVANARLKKLGVFDSVTITLDAGPPELPGTANVVVEVSEGKIPLSGEFGIIAEPKARSFSLDWSLKLRNLFGYADLWDGSVSYGWDQVPEISMGVSLPRFKPLGTPLSARISLLSQDWLKFPSNKEQVLGLSLGLLSAGNHEVSYNLSWRTLSDPSQMSSDSVRSELGHSLFSALKHSFKIDRRDSTMRPTRGHAFVSNTQIGGLFPDVKSLHLIRQEFDFRYAIPLGFYRAALNFGVSGGVVFPWGNGNMNTSSYIPERFFMGGDSSPVCYLRGPSSGLGFKARGLLPAKPRKLFTGYDNSNDGNFVTSDLDHIGDLNLTAFADFSFDLPLSVFRKAGIHGHMFACTGSLNKLTKNGYKEFPFLKFRDSFRSLAGFGLVIPTKLFLMEVNYCYSLKQREHDRVKSGVQLSFLSLQ
ncbi:hypothetical protein ACS0TY_011118 [Phlomoides rotata]